MLHGTDLKLAQPSQCAEGFDQQYHPHSLTSELQLNALATVTTSPHHKLVLLSELTAQRTEANRVSKFAKGVSVERHLYSKIGLKYTLTVSSSEQ